MKRESKLDLTEKVCRACGFLKPADDFYRNRGYLSPKCKPCTSKHRPSRRKDGYIPPLPSGEMSGNTAYLNAKLFTKAERESYPKNTPRHGVCELCLNERRLVHDHCHDTGRFRGVICYGCNQRIALMDREPSWYERAAVYRIVRTKREL